MAAKHELSPIEHRLVELITSFERPVDRAVLEFMVDCSGREAEFEELGPHPRTTALAQALGHLYDVYILDFTPEGIVIK